MSSANFFKIDTGDTSYIHPRDGADSVLQKWPKMAQMTPVDLLALKMVWTEPQGVRPKKQF